MKNASCAVKSANSCINVQKINGRSCPQTQSLDHTHAHSKEKNVSGPDTSGNINCVWPQASPTSLPHSDSLVQHLKWQRGATQSLCTVGFCLHKLRDFHSNLCIAAWRNGKKMSPWPLVVSLCVTLVWRMIYLYYIHCGSAWCLTEVQTFALIMADLSLVCSVSRSLSSARLLSQNNLARLSEVETYSRTCGFSWWA